MSRSTRTAKVKAQCEISTFYENEYPLIPTHRYSTRKSSRRKTKSALDKSSDKVTEEPALGFDDSSVNPTQHSSSHRKPSRIVTKKKKPVVPDQNEDDDDLMDIAQCSSGNKQSREPPDSKANVSKSQVRRRVRANKLNENIPESVESDSHETSSASKKPKVLISSRKNSKPSLKMCLRPEAKKKIEFITTMGSNTILRDEKSQHSSSSSSKLSTPESSSENSEDMDSDSETVKPKKKRNASRKSSMNSSKTATNQKKKRTTISSEKEPHASEPIDLNSYLEAVPPCPLPCRETQFQQVWEFLLTNILKKASRSVFVHGIPGTGKTAIVNSVLDALIKIKDDSMNANLDFTYAFINGLKLSSPEKIWVKLYKAIKGTKLGASTAYRKLETYFTSELDRPPLILVIDEFDQLLDKQQTILYRLLEWSLNQRCMFSFVGIFNTMRITDSMFAKRNESRCSYNARIVFSPYNHEQLKLIIDREFETNGSSDKLSADAVLLIARKVASISGDARRALNLMKRSLEISSQQNCSSVEAVREAFKESFCSKLIPCIRSCSKLEKRCLRYIAAELGRRQSDDIELGEVVEDIGSDCKFEGIPWTLDQFLATIGRLEAVRLLEYTNDSLPFHTKISLNGELTPEDIIHGLDEEMKAAVDKANRS